MRKRNLILLLFILCTLFGYAQDAVDVVPKVIPPSPNAAALEKFSTIPVDYSTGVPSISYPMWEWQRGKLSFKLGLNYHAGGHKVDDMPSNVGLGWSLTGIGRVSRTVRGVADDDMIKGFMYTNTLPSISTSSYNGQDFYYTSSSIYTQTNYSPFLAITQYNSPSSGLIRDIVESQMDGEQDIFSFSFGGFSGRFIIDKNRNIIPLEHTRVKIEMVCYSTAFPYNGSSGKINYFKITDDKGVVYKFEYQENLTSETMTNPTPIPPIPIQSYISGWLLTKIIDPTTQDSIVINHVNTGGSGGQYETGFSQNQTIGILPNGSFGSPGGANSYQATAVNDLAPASVSLPDGSTIEFEYNFTRADMVGSKAMTKVTVKNYQTTVIKKYQLSYSYYTSGDGVAFPGWGYSSNDYSKRLRLDQIDEMSSDNALAKPTIFTYNPTLLNARGSFNTDFWGYNVNPARNNIEYVPEIPLTGTPEIVIAPFLEGADRRPDANYVKAAVLEKIQYPTGGFVSFEYECNKAFSTLNYFEDKLQTNTPVWDYTTFGSTYTFTMPNRIVEGIEFFFRAEFDPNGTPQSNDPPTCFEDGQDYMIVRFEINSTDASFFTYREYTYAQLIGGLGIKETIALPLNKTYEVKCIYNHTANCAFLHPFKTLVTGTYDITPQDKLAGGLRIKKITANDGTGVVLTKEYEYNNTDGHSSAVFTSSTNIPNYGFYRTGVDNSSGTPSVHENYLNRTSNPTNSLNFNGAPLVYARVIEKEKDGSLTERQYDALVSAANGGDPTEYPYLPVQDFPNLSGLLTKQIVKDNTGVAKTEQTITYNKVQTYLSGQAQNRNIRTGTIATSAGYTAKYYVADLYYMYTSRAEVTSDETKIYEGAVTLTSKQDKTYDPFTYYLKTVKATNSKNEDRTEEYSYVADGGPGVISVMITKNMLNYITHKTFYKTNVVNGELTHTKTNYLAWQSGALPMPSSIESSILGNTLETDITFNEYDDKGNILQYMAKDGLITSFVWGYNKQYPVAKIIGKTYSDALTQSGLVLATVNAPVSDAAMRTELNKLRTLTNCMVTTYTYKPLVGITSEVDANGKIIYYEYDNFNRATLIRDHDNNILKKFCYNYQGQPVTCGYGATPAWQPISSICQPPNKVITEKDMNPSSPTYNQTRTVTITNDPTCVCTGNDKKIVNGICETGVEICDGNYRVGSVWYHNYHYQWSDNSISITYSGGAGICF
jgi:hypothetical protein